MIGAVVHQELLLGSRRNRLLYFRWAYVIWLVAQIGFFSWKFLTSTLFARLAGMTPGASVSDTPVSAPQVIGSRFADAFITQQFILLAIATPALVAGAITDEKRRGTLQHLLLAGMDTRSLLLGKLLGRSAQVGILALAGLPLFALLAGFGGVEPLTFLAFLALSVLTVLAIAAAALLASVWCRQTRDAVLALYAVGIAAGLATWQFNDVLDSVNPVSVLASANWIDAAEFGRRVALALLCWGTVGGVCLGLAVWRLKPAYLREMEGQPVKRPSWYAGRRSAVDDDPVRWRERHVEGLAPVANLRRVPQWLAVAAIFLLTTCSSLCILGFSLLPGTLPADVFEALRHVDLATLESQFPGAAGGFLVQGVVILLLASLVVGIRCSGAVTGERERQTWEALLLAPLTTRELVQGKLWGIMGASYVYLLACALPAIVLSVLAGPLALFWTVVWLAVSVLAMYFIGAAGLWSSVRSKSSWQALLKTLAFGYLGGAVVNIGTSVLVYAVLAVFVMMLMAVDIRLQTGLAKTFLSNLSQAANMYLFAISLSLAVTFWLAARFYFLTSAQTWIAQRERTRHWRAAPVYRRTKRRLRRVAR
jgi:ABC-type transport system involved in multi-copper enzyme maturation permease subunit